MPNKLIAVLLFKYDSRELEEIITVKGPIIIFFYSLV